MNIEDINNRPPRKSKTTTNPPELIQGPGVLPKWGGKQVVKREGGW